MKNASELKTRDLSIKKKFRLSALLGSWEMILVYILILINVILIIFRSDLYFAPGTVAAIIQSSLDLSFMVLGMIFILLLGDIDVSIASTMIASAAALGLVYQSGAGAPAAILCGLMTGALCGLFNGVLVAKLKMPAVIVTISTSMLFRGIVQIVLGVNSLKTFPDWFSQLGWGSFLGIPIILICFLAFSVLFGLVLHKTKFGRLLYITGNNRITAEYSGIAVDRLKIAAFVIMGLMAGVSSIFFIGRFGGVSSTMATGYELDVIAITVLGGVSTAGGKGKIFGPVIAALVMEFLFYALGLFGVEANVRKIITGVVLIVAVLIPRINGQLLKDAYRRFFCHNSREIESLRLRLKKEVAGYRASITQTKSDTSLDADAKAAKLSELQSKIKSASERNDAAVKALLKELR